PQEVRQTRGHQKRLRSREVVKQTDQTNGSQNSRQKRVYKKTKTSQEVVKREDNDLAEEVVTNEDSNERKTSTTDTDLKSIKDNENQKRLNRKPNRVFKLKVIHCDYKDCDYKCRSDAGLASHMKSHNNQKTETYRQQRLSLHRRCYDLVTNSYICDETDCEKEFKKIWDLRQHITRTHINKTICCDYTDCGKLFKTLEAMKAHYRYIHSDDKPYKCPHNGCGQRFIHNSRLEAHVACHVTDRRFKCDFIGCHKDFKTGPELHSHKRIHNTEPTFKCAVEGCRQRFHLYTQLEKHRQSVHSWPSRRVRHPGHRVPCLWPGCDFRAEKHRLKHHERKHTGERPYVCDWPECGKRFARPDGLKDHKNIHNNVKPYACHWPGCQYRCASSANICKHYKQVHQK
ncbi:unnamed protein product, partial [Medioppia subpectinata]